MERLVNRIRISKAEKCLKPRVIPRQGEMEYDFDYGYKEIYHPFSIISYIKFKEDDGN